MKHRGEKQTSLLLYTDSTQRNPNVPPCRSTIPVKLKQTIPSQLDGTEGTRRNSTPPKATQPSRVTKLIGDTRQYSLPQQIEEQVDIISNIFPELKEIFDNISLSESIAFFCPYCGSINPEGHVKKDIRGRNHKPEVQRWACKKFKHKFTNDPSPFNYPLWISYFTCSDLAAGKELAAIKKSLEMVAEEKQESISITIPAIRYLLKRSLELIHGFEESIKQPIESEVWEMDELSQRMSKDGSRRRRAWIITVSADSSRYLLATYICYRRCKKHSLAALQIARFRAKSDPKVIKSDGLASHTNAAKALFPNAKVISIPKKVHFGNISHEEGIHKKVRLGALPKRRRFNSPTTLEIYTELDRIDYNYIRTNDSPTKTPAQKAGIDFGIHNWKELINCALRFRMKKQVIEAHLKLHAEQKNKRSKKKLRNN